MNFNIQWINCSVTKYERRETFSIGRFRADIAEDPMTDLSITATWSITDKETGELLYGDTFKTAHVLTMLQGNPDDVYAKAKEDCEKHMLKLMDKMLTDVIEKEVLQ